MPKAYDPKLVEQPIFESWQDGGYFSAEIVEGVQPYSVVIPPPNVTGSLHMGHALNNTIQDVVCRRSRMTGRPTLWVVGTDHAGIATQNKVEQKLHAEGKSRHDLGREEFIEACWEWRREYGGTIISQLKAMGCSCDYDNERFTMDPGYATAVRRVFVDWFNRGLIYRGKRIINWCPRCSTALSDIEVEHEDVDSHLWHLRYPLKEPVGGIDHVVVATTRPETMLGDTCIAVHPDDERYKAIVGATVVLPLMGREIPVVADDYVDPSFGSGAVKVTPAHDPNDFDIGERHDCAKINIMNADATISEEGGVYAGLERYEARKRVLADLDAAGLLVKTDDHVHSVGHCYRCHTVIEPWLSDQWFVDMKPLAAPAIEAVRDGRTTFHPKRWENVYFHWMENIRDWCISRQLWWGHRIPVFYCDACGADGRVDGRPHRVPEVRQHRHAPGRGRPRHVVLVATLALRHARLARADAGARLLLSHQRALDRPRHPLPVGRAHGDERHGLRRRRDSVPRRHHPSHRLQLRGQADEQVARHRRRSARSHGALRRRRHALRPHAPGHGCSGPQVRRGQAAFEPQLREQDLERQPLRHDEPRGVRARRP